MSACNDACPAPLGQLSPRHRRASSLPPSSGVAAVMSTIGRPIAAAADLASHADPALENQPGLFDLRPSAVSPAS